MDQCLVLFEVLAVAYATGPRVQPLLRPGSGDAAVLVVSDRVTADAKQVLEQSGWGYLDRRGHLRLRAPGILVDTRIPASPITSDSTVGEPLVGAAGLAIAYRLLTCPDA